MNLKSNDSALKTLIWFLIALGALNLLQAFQTPINPDEAYYWMYSKYLAWGYFDHPPMIAIMIRLGDMLFHNELGVRFLVVVSQIGTLWIIWELINEDQQLTKSSLYIFMMLVAILPVFNIYGFIATPDAPLLFFTAVFLLLYNRFLKQENWKNTLLLGVSMACLVYSKYHGALLIIIVIFSNLKLLRSPKFYSASILAVLLFLPHLLWQYSNDFPSVKYHLVDRVSGFVIGNVPQYLLNLLLIHNPFILPVFIWLIFKSKPKNQFEKTLSYVIYGFIVFFFISSFRYRVEPQWTAVISIPMVILLLRNPGFESRFGNYLKWVTIFSLPVLLFVRIAFMVDFLPVSYLKKGYHNTKERAIEIGKIAGDKPVVFTNSYQDASKYTFYTGKFAHTLNNLNYRKNQYDLWDFEEKIHGKEVLYVPHFMTDNIRNTFTKHVFSTGDSAYVRVYTDFQSLQRECVALSDISYNYSISKTNSIHLKIFNPYPFKINLNNKDFPVVFQIGFFKNGKLEYTKRLILPEGIVALQTGETISADCSFTLEGLAPGKYKIAICSESGIQYITINSALREAMVAE